MAERSFKARLERRLALLLEEGLQASNRRRWTRATAVGNNSLQVHTVCMHHTDRYTLLHLTALNTFHMSGGAGGHAVRGRAPPGGLLLRRRSRW